MAGTSSTTAQMALFSAAEYAPENQVLADISTAVREGADPIARDSYGKSAIELLANRGNEFTPAIHYLEAAASADKNMSLLAAAEHGDIYRIRGAIDTGATNSLEAISLAEEATKPHIAAYIEAYTSANKPMTLNAAAEHGDLFRVQAVLDAGIDLEKHGASALTYARQNGDPAVVLKLEHAMGMTASHEPPSPTLSEASHERGIDAARGRQL